MTAAAFQATFTDWRLIKGRKCVQIVFEVPVEAADEAYHVLGGMPDPGKSVWCAIARLRDDNRKEGDAASNAGNRGPAREAADIGTTAASRPRKQVAPEKRLIVQAALCCADPVFQRFLFERKDIEAPSEELATLAVRWWCNVESRSEIIPGTSAGEKWELLHGNFIAWRDHDMPAGEAA